MTTAHGQSIQLRTEAEISTTKSIPELPTRTIWRRIRRIQTRNIAGTPIGCDGILDVSADKVGLSHKRARYDTVAEE